MQTLEYLIDTADRSTFTGLAAAFVRSRGYRTKEFRADTGEWSARIWMRDRPGIACASVEEDWRAALRSSARKVKRLEHDRGTEYGLFVFLTNQDVTGLQEFEMEGEIAREYGWRLRLYHRQDLIGELYNTAPGLAKHHLDVGLGFETGHLATLEELREERLDTIHARGDEATELPDGPAVVLHIVPNGIFATERRWASSEIPTPSLLSGTDSAAVDTRSELTIAYGPDAEEYTEYALLRADGLYEAVTTAPFDSSDELLREVGETGIERSERIKRASEIDGEGFDAAIVGAARETLTHHSRMGFSATASVWITLLDAENAGLRSESTNRSPPALGFERYTTKVATASIDERESSAVASDLEPVLSEIWRAFGYPDGTPRLADSEGRDTSADGSASG